MAKDRQWLSRQHLLAMAIIAVMITLDQISKDWAVNLLMDNAFRPIELTSFFNLVMVWNTGVSFGMFAGDGNSAHWLLVLLPGLVTLGLVVWMFRSDKATEIYGLAFVVSGASGNLLDRINRGAVADFFDFHAAGWHFWAFNIADAAISIGVAILLYDAFFNASKSET
jgi:signal peptidase II